MKKLRRVSFLSWCTRVRVHQRKHGTSDASCMKFLSKHPAQCWPMLKDVWLAGLHDRDARRLEKPYREAARWYNRACVARDEAAQRAITVWHRLYRDTP